METTHFDYLKETRSWLVGPLRLILFRSAEEAEADVRFCISSRRGYYLSRVVGNEGTVARTNPALQGREATYSLMVVGADGSVALRLVGGETNLIVLSETLFSLLSPVMGSLKAIRTYLWDYELKSFCRGPDETHIFHHVRALDRWLKGHTGDMSAPPNLTWMQGEPKDDLLEGCDESCVVPHERLRKEDADTTTRFVVLWHDGSKMGIGWTEPAGVARGVAENPRRRFVPGQITVSEQLASALAASDVVRALESHARQYEAMEAPVTTDFSTDHDCGGEKFRIVTRGDRTETLVELRWP